MVLQVGAGVDGLEVLAMQRQVADADGPRRAARLSPAAHLAFTRRSNSARAFAWVVVGVGFAAAVFGALTAAR